MPPMRYEDVQAWLAERDRVPVVLWHDELVESLGHHPATAYVETYWLPIVGPSALWALRRLVGWLEDSPGGYPLAIAPLARELGLGSGTSKSAPVIRTLCRLVSFGLATRQGNALAVRRAVPPLAQRHIRRLPEHLVEQHRADHESGPRGAHAASAVKPW